MQVCFSGVCLGDSYTNKIIRVNPTNLSTLNCLNVQDSLLQCFEYSIRTLPYHFKVMTDRRVFYLVY